MGWTYGIHAVETLLGERPEDVQEVWFVRSRKPGRARERVREMVEKVGVRFRIVDDRSVTKAVGDVTHQGVIARIADFEYADAAALLAVEGPATLVVLDEVQDPHNLGAIIRTCAGLEAAGVIIPRHRSASVTAAVRKVAVGAEQRVPVAQVTNIARFLEASQEAGFWSYAFAADGDEQLGSLEMSDRAVLVLGSEGRGVRRNVGAKCDVSVAIPMGEMESLNVSVAAGIALWEWRRSRPSSKAVKTVDT